MAFRIGRAKIKIGFMRGPRGISMFRKLGRKNQIRWANYDSRKQRKIYKKMGF